jgi:hypothetical protein
MRAWLRLRLRTSRQAYYLMLGSTVVPSAIYNPSILYTYVYTLIYTLRVSGDGYMR